MCRAHILTNCREIARCKDNELVGFCTGKENCRRNLLLKALGSDEHTEPQSRCCDVCTPSTPRDADNILQTTSVKRQPRKRVVRHVSSQQFDDLKKALEIERENIILTDMGLRMLGKEIVLSTECIVDICKASKYIESETDLMSVSGLRKGLVKKVYDVLVSVFN